jgi:hypothetical protein
MMIVLVAKIVSEESKTGVIDGKVRQLTSIHYTGKILLTTW